jgi:D-glycero-D-manno-heptose 1,7-bisphosphate phosphatase
MMQTPSKIIGTNFGNTRPCLYLDRDGIINRHYPYVGTIDRFDWHEEIIDIIAFFSRKGYRIVIVTNQSGIARGLYSRNDFVELSMYLINHIWSTLGVSVEMRFCPHLPDSSCQCRKPKTGMLDVDKRLPADILVGDQETDMHAAQKAGIRHRWLVGSRADDASIAFTRSAVDHYQFLEHYRLWYSRDIVEQQ